VHHPAVCPREAPETAFVEVERVEKTRGRLARDPVSLDAKPSPLELAEERTQELVATAARRWDELVENSEIGSSPTSEADVDLGSTLSHDPLRCSPSANERGTRHPGDAHRSTVAEPRAAAMRSTRRCA
jgi:hypothetical protein